MSTDKSDVATEVDQVLVRAGLKLTAEDRERLVRVYPVIRGLLPQLRLPEARYAEPALIYPAQVGT